MLRPAAVAALALAALAASFAYGAAVVRYEWFPYAELRELKRIVVPELRLPRTYHARLGHFQQLEAELDVVVVGDSHVQRAEWAEMFPELSIGNRGISGDRTDGVLARIDDVLSTGAERVVLMLGFNDLRAGLELDPVESSYGKILEGLTEAGVEVIVVSTLLAARPYDATNARVEALNERLRARAAASDRISFLDLNPVLAPRGFLAERYTTDGIHLNGDGYRVWQAELRPYLEGAPRRATGRAAAEHAAPGEPGDGGSRSSNG